MTVGTTITSITASELSSICRLPAPTGPPGDQHTPPPQPDSADSINRTVTLGGLIVIDPHLRTCIAIVAVRLGHQFRF